MLARIMARIMTYSGIDLHTHTTASDGALKPDELLKLAIQNGTQMLAITDHDTITGYLAARNTVQHKALAIGLISGVEISTTWQGMGLHIVGLHFDPEHPAITRLLASQARARRLRCQMILDKLAKINMLITFEELQAGAGHGHIGRPHIAQIMIAKGYVANMSQAFKKYLGAGKIGDVKSGWVSLAETVTAINDSGGIAVIAHPNHYKMTRSKLLHMIDEFIALGGRGIEVISGKQHAEITMKFAHIASDKGLLASVGSDFHRYLPYAPSVGQLPHLPELSTLIWTLFNT